MPYDEPRYISRDTLGRSIAGTQTYTASAVVLTQTVASIPCPDAAYVVDAAATVDTIGVGTSYVLQLQNGAVVLATGAISNTAGNVSGLTVLSTASLSAVAANGPLSLVVIGTGTASAAQVNPVMQVSVGIKKQFV